MTLQWITRFSNCHVNFLTALIKGIGRPTRRFVPPRFHALNLKRVEASWKACRFTKPILLTDPKVDFVDQPSVCHMFGEWVTALLSPTRAFSKRFLQRANTSPPPAMKQESGPELKDSGNMSTFIALPFNLEMKFNARSGPLMLLPKGSADHPILTTECWAAVAHRKLPTSDC